MNTDIATRDGLENLGEKNGNNPKSHGFYLVIGVSLKNCHFRDVPHFSWDKPSCKVLQVGKLNTQLEAVQGSFEVDVALELFRESVDLLTERFRARQNEAGPAPHTKDLSCKAENVPQPELRRRILMLQASG